MAAKTETFKGVVVRNVFSSDNFKIYAVDVDMDVYGNIKRNKYGNVSVSGDIPTLTTFKEYEFTATPENGKYGYVYKVKNIKKDFVYDESDIESFLTEMLTDNQREEIMREYPNIIQLIHEGRTNEIKADNLRGIGEITLDKIIERIKINMVLFEYVAEFQGYIPLSVIKKLAEKFTHVDKIKQALAEKPYEALCSLSRIGFKSADVLLLDFEQACNEAKEEGKEPILNFSGDLKSSRDRCLAYIHYLLEESESSGSTKMNLKELRDKCKVQVRAAFEHFNDCIKDESVWYDVDTMEVAKTKTRNVEVYIAETVKGALNSPCEQWLVNVEDFRMVDDIVMTDEQMDTMSMLSNNNISILTSPGGGGKSSSVKSVINMLESKHINYLLCSPTGRAAKVLENYTNRPASTIHRALGYNPMEKGWFYTKDNPLPFEVIIIDEFSMVDIFLFKHLLEAVDFNKTRLLLVGDPYQIPSVGCGRLFHDFIGSGIIPTNRLTKIFRYAEGGLLKVATDIRNNKCYVNDNMLSTSTPFGSNKDYVLIDMNQESMIRNTVRLYSKLLEKGEVPRDIMVVVAQNVGDLGADALNTELQKVANPNFGKGVSMGNRKETYYVGDLVMQTRNNYHAMTILGNEVLIANGETGVITDIENNRVYIDFDGVHVIYTKNDMLSDDIKLGYAISIFKAQGSQSKIVIAVTPKAHTFMLNSNLLYTGLTRAKKICYHIGNIATIKGAIKKRANFERQTFMQDLLA